MPQIRKRKWEKEQIRERKVNFRNIEICSFTNESIKRRSILNTGRNRGIFSSNRL